jgi:hypothetical protein
MSRGCLAEILGGTELRWVGLELFWLCQRLRGKVVSHECLTAPLSGTMSRRLGFWRSVVRVDDQGVPLPWVAPPPPGPLPQGEGEGLACVNASDFLCQHW